MPTSGSSDLKHVSQQKENTGKLRRLTSITNLTKPFMRRQSNNKENTALPQISEHNTFDSMSCAQAPARPRRVSSPHPKKEILPRSVTFSNLPVARARLPSTNTSVSLFSNPLPSSPARAVVARQNVEARSAISERSRSRIPTPTSKQSSLRLHSYKVNGSLPGLQPRAIEVKETDDGSVTNKASMTPELSPFAFQISTEEPQASQKLKHRDSKSPRRKEVRQPDSDQLLTHQAPTASTRLHSAYDVVHHSLLKAISPPALPLPVVDRVEVKRISTSRSPNRGSQDWSDKLDGSASADIYSAHCDIQALDGFVHQAEASTYWTGRFITLNDRFWHDSDDTPRPSASGGAQLMQSREEARAKRVLDILGDNCLTEAAKKSLWQFRVQMAAIKNMPSLLTSQSNTHVSIDGVSCPVSISSTEYTSHTGSIEGLGMPQRDNLPKGPERIETRPSWSTPSTFGSYGSCKSQLLPQPLAISRRKTINSSSSSETDPLPVSPLSKNGSSAFSIGSVLAGDIDEKDKKRMNFVEKLIGRGRRESSGTSSLSNAVYPGT